MSAIRASIGVALLAALASGTLVLGYELAALDPAYRAAQPLSPWAAAGAMALFTLAAGAFSTAICALLGRWFPPGLGLFALGVLGVGVSLWRLALDTKPAEAPMYVALHVVFVVAFGIVIPAVWYVHAG